MTSKEKDLPCFDCGKRANWLYMPKSNLVTERERWACDEHVPRNCRFCNSNKNGVPNPKPWEPCVDWFYLGDSPDVD